MGAASYAPIAQLLHALPADEKDKLRKKLDIAYFVATEKLPFTAYPSICQLETQHGVDIFITHNSKTIGRI